MSRDVITGVRCVSCVGNVVVGEMGEVWLVKSRRLVWQTGLVSGKWVRERVAGEMREVWLRKSRSLVWYKEVCFDLKKPF